MDYSIILEYERINSQPDYVQCQELMTLGDRALIINFFNYYPNAINYETHDGKNWLYFVLNLLPKYVFQDQHIVLFKYLYEIYIKNSENKEYEKTLLASHFLSVINTREVVNSKTNDNFQNQNFQKVIWEYLLEEKFNVTFNSPEGTIDIVSTMWQLNKDTFLWVESRLKHHEPQYEITMYEKKSIPLFFSILRGYRNRGLISLFVQKYPELIDLNYVSGTSNIAYVAASSPNIDEALPIVFDMLIKAGLEDYIYKLKPNGMNIFLYIIIQMNMLNKIYLPPLCEYIKNNMKNIIEYMTVERAEKNHKPQSLYQFLMSSKGIKSPEVQQFFKDIVEAR